MGLEAEFRGILSEIADAGNAYARIAFVGQPGAGKSSIINGLLGHRAAATGQETDNTQEAAEYSYLFNKLVDLPGYGTNMFRFTDWKQRFQPEQYDVFVFVFSGKLTDDDSRMLSDLRAYAEHLGRTRPVLLVRNHGEELEEEQQADVRADIYAHLGLSETDVPLYFVDCRYQTGFDELARAFRGIDYKDIWQSRIQGVFYKECLARLDRCRRDAWKTVSGHRIAAGLNGANPIPGFDISVDIAVYMDMFQAIRKAYHIEDEDLKRFSVMPVVGQILNLATKSGLLLLLKNFAGRVMVQKVSKYVPFVGTAVAAGIGYKLCEYAGGIYIEDCEEAAGKIMDALMEEQLIAWEDDSDLMLLQGGN